MKRARKAKVKKLKAGTLSITLNDFFKIDFLRRNAIRTADGKKASWYRPRKQPGTLSWFGIRVPKYVKEFVAACVFKQALVS